MPVHKFLAMREGLGRADSMSDPLILYTSTFTQLIIIFLARLLGRSVRREYPPGSAPAIAHPIPLGAVILN